MKRVRRPRKVGKDFLSQRIVASLGHSDAKPNASVRATLLRELGRVPEVEYILYGERGSIKVVVSVINSFDPQARHAIYGCQRAIARRLPAEQFDFYVMARENRNPQEFVPTDMQLIYGREGKGRDLK